MLLLVAVVAVSLLVAKANVNQPLSFHVVYCFIDLEVSTALHGNRDCCPVPF